MILKNFKFLLLILIIIFYNNIENVKCDQEDIFTAVADMKSMISTESILIGYLENYINAAELKINNLKKALTEHKIDFTNLSQKLMEPNEIFKSIGLIKYLSQFTEKFFNLEDIIEDNLEKKVIKNVTQIQNIRKFPTEYDLSGAAYGLARLQDVYNMTIGNFSKLLNSRNITEGLKLNHVDYYIVGLHLFNDNLFEQSEPWIMEAFNNYNETITSHKFNEISRSHLLEILAWINYKRKNYDLAIHYSKEFLKIKPNAHHVETNLKQFEFERNQFLEETKKKNSQIYNSREDLASDVFEKYKIGCRNELKRSIKILSHLECWYLTETNNFLIYAPVKIEEINYDPEMFMFHDVISDTEIKTLQNLVNGKLVRAKVWDSTKKQEYRAEYRTNKLAWLDYNSNPIISRIKQRIGDMTGLSMKTSESLQVANYGIGGHYDPHHDFHYQTDDADTFYPNYEWGNRLSTLVFYMSDVKTGGATVFPLLNITIYPQKGSALFWYNLFASGAGDLRTYHAACPVLEGDKWILNQWIHEREQEFNRPCNLERDDI